MFDDAPWEIFHFTLNFLGATYNKADFTSYFAVKLKMSVLQYVFLSMPNKKLRGKLKMLLFTSEMILTAPACLFFCLHVCFICAESLVLFGIHESLAYFSSSQCVCLQI